MDLARILAPSSPPVLDVDHEGAVVIDAHRIADALLAAGYRKDGIDDALWTTAQTVAAERGENLSDIIRAALVAYVSKWGNK